MLTMISVLSGLLLLLLLALILGVGLIYNRLVILRNEARNAWAQIDVQLKRRHDLIPNLVDTVKGYLQHEHKTLEAVVKARQQVVQQQPVLRGAGQAEATEHPRAGAHA